MCILYWLLTRSPLHRKQADGLFLSVAQDLAAEYPDIKFDEILLDRACLHVK